MVERIVRRTVRRTVRRCVRSSICRNCGRVHQMTGALTSLWRIWYVHVNNGGQYYIVGCCKLHNYCEKRWKQLRESRRGRLWCQLWLTRRRSEQGMEHFVLNELALTDTGGFHSFWRMSPSAYDDLLRLVEPHITKNRHAVEIASRARCHNGT